MKAILVIDIDDSLIEGEDDRFAIDGYLMQESDAPECYEAVGYITNAVLKPMPDRKCIKNEDEFMDVCGWMEQVQIGMDIGWNACLEEIE